MRFAAAVALSLHGIALAAPGQTALSTVVPEAPEAALTRGQKAYNDSHFDDAARVLRDLLYPTVQLASDDEQRARKFLALSYFLLGKEAAAAHEMQALLQLNPTFTLDSVLDPPKAILFLEELRRKNLDRLREITEQKRREEEDRQREEARRRGEETERIRRSLQPDLVVRTVEKHHFLLNLLPFGVGQLQNGDTRKAYLFLSTQAALAATSLSLWLAVEGTRAAWSTRKELPGERAQLGNVQIAQVVAGAVFWVDVAVGIVDAILHYKREIITEKRVTPPPAGTPGRAPSATPFLAPSGAGVSLQGVF